MSKDSDDSLRAEGMVMAADIVLRALPGQAGIDLVQFLLKQAGVLSGREWRLNFLNEIHEAVTKTVLS